MIHSRSIRSALLVAATLLLPTESQGATPDQWGVMTHLNSGVRPGLKIEARWLGTEKELSRDRRRVYSWGPSLGSSIHQGTNLDTFADASLNWRTWTPEGYFSDWGTSIGILRSTYLIPTVEVLPNGTTATIEHAGRTYSRWTGSFGLGQALPSHPWFSHWFIRSEASVLIPYNAGFVPFVALQAGVNLANRGTE